MGPGADSTLSEGSVGGAVPVVKRSGEEREFFHELLVADLREATCVGVAAEHHGTEDQHPDGGRHYPPVNPPGGIRPVVPIDQSVDRTEPQT